MIHEEEKLDPNGHRCVVVLTDDFGMQHTYVHPTHVAIEDPKNPFPRGSVVKLVPYDREPELRNIKILMEQREQEFLAYCLKHPHHQHHPAVLGHPDHPRNKGPQ
jgi:hypothetical protein